MSIRKFRAGRVSTVTASEHIGQFGDVFYDETTGQFRVSNGTTPGGTVVATALNLANGTADVFVNNLTVAGTNTTINNIVSNNETTVTGVLTVTGNAEFDGNTTTTGHFHAYGPSEFTGDTTFIGNVTEVGNLTITGKAINNGPSIFNGAMTITGDSLFSGNLSILVPVSNSLSGAVSIIGNNLEQFQAPIQTGVMLQITGQQSDVSRIYMDGVNNYNVITGRRYNGTPTSPTGVKANNIIARYGSNGLRSDGTWNTGGVARMEVNALEDFTPTSQASNIVFYTTSIGSTTATPVVSIDNANGIITTKATVTGNLIAGNVISNTVGTVYGNVVGTTGTFSGNVTANYLRGKIVREVRNAGTIADGGTLTIDFSTDAIVHCVWGNGMTLAYQNFMPGRIVKVMATKATGSGTDTLSLDGVTASQVSTGVTSISGTADQTNFIELICTNSSLGSVFVKL